MGKKYENILFNEIKPEMRHKKAINKVFIVISPGARNKEWPTLFSHL